MTTSEEAPGKLRISSVGGAMGRLSRLVLTLLVILAILLIAGVFAVKTDGFRDIACNHLTKKMGMDMSVTAMRIGWPYDLIAENVESAGFAEDAPGFRCSELRVGLGRRSLYRICMTGAELVLAKDADARWIPSRFGRLGEISAGNILELSRISETMRKRVALVIEEGSVVWLSGEPATRAAGKGVTFRVAPVDIPGRRMYHYFLSVDSAVDGNGARVRGVTREWLASETIEYLEMSASEAETEGPPQPFWEVNE